MHALWIKLSSTFDEIQGKGSKESVVRASKHLCYTYTFLAIVTVATTACAVYLITKMILLDVRNNLNPDTLEEWMKTFGLSIMIFSAILVVYLLLVFFLLKKKLHEIFNK